MNDNFTVRFTMWFNINNITFDYRDSLNEKGLDVINCKELNSELFYFSKKIYNC